MSARIRAAWLAVVAFACVVATGHRAAADDFLKSSPGELASSHASLDTKDGCPKCHEPDNSISANKCLSCHDHSDLKRRIAKREGFHVSVKVKSTPCKFCHQEHRGRRFDLMGWAAIGGTKNFDHRLTGWTLNGKHAAAKCERCHTSSNKQGLRTYLNTDPLCGSCHKKDNPHGAVRAAGMACNRCHTESVWKPQKTKLEFDHDDQAQARMPLEGVHADVACAKCHPKAAFKLPAFDGDCAQCHASPHAGHLFSKGKCSGCHTPALRSLRQVKFDHRKQAGYALLGKHAQISCNTCHTKARGKTKPPEGCETCHARDNQHGKRFRAFPACASCHSQKQWKGSFQFDHGANTKFALTGKHEAVGCRDCHRGKTPSRFEAFEIKNGCMSCHRHKTAHGGKFKNDQCLTCHTQGGTKKMRTDSLETFHGEDSKFPLTKGHAKVQCQLCHVNDVYQQTPRECGVSCHEDSLHKGALGNTCSNCHEPGTWPAVRFDHTADTTWPLKGKHAAVKACDSCHPTRAYESTPTGCGAVGCHQQDDVHQGKLGDKCGRCHVEDGRLQFQHNRDAAFKVDGKHVPLLCASCHPSVAFKPVRADCFGCHPEPAIHAGRYGTTCDKCHSTSSFADIKAQHDVGDFSLTGAHDQLDCSRCHPNGEKLRGSGNLCITCHRKDDIHRNALSPRCGECHTQQAFTPARFDHVSTGCALTGLHSTLPCADCHKHGNYGAVSPLCASCHRADALRVRQPDHRSLIDCGGCHNPSSWIPATPLGLQTICR